MDEQLYLWATGLSLDEKISKAIENLREYEKEAVRRDPAHGYYLCDSYGKDSAVIRHLAKVAKVRHGLHHNLTTLDPPELIYFGRGHHPETIIHKPPMSMLTRLQDSPNRGPPTRLKRWCCAEYKEGRGNKFVKVFGIRAAESSRRKINWKVWTSERKTDSWILNPILYWTDEDVWRYIQREKIPYCSLYDEGWKRLGCVGCPMAGDMRRKEFIRWPKYELAWKRAFAKFWDRWHGVPRKDGQARWFDKKEELTCWEDLWKWWMEELPEPADDDCQMGLF